MKATCSPGRFTPSLRLVYSLYSFPQWGQFVQSHLTFLGRDMSPKPNLKNCFFRDFQCLYFARGPLALPVDLIVRRQLNGTFALQLIVPFLGIRVQSVYADWESVYTDGEPAYNPCTRFGNPRTIRVHGLGIRVQSMYTDWESAYNPNTRFWRISPYRLS